MQKVTIPANYREETGKGVARKLRRSGEIPAVVYSKGSATSLRISKLVLRKMLSSGVHRSYLVSLDLPDGKSKNAIISEFQLHPVLDEVLHIDFFEVELDKPISMKLDIVLKGTAVGAKEGGSFSHGVRDVLVEALPSDMPDYISVDVSGLRLGDSIHVHELSTPGKIKVICKHNEMVASVLLAKAETAVESEAGEEEPSGE